ncbi:MAG: hypothetical protein EPO08_20995 [Rhodospirillaceae bacterium]|nr:MAG: hypothetical protein EPO08_20995 [Rhodospirillaceae bacterium]
MSVPTKAVGVPFKVHLIGATTGKAWPGEFRAKKSLSFRDKLAADAYRRELIGGVAGAVDGEAAAAALVISQLSVRLTECPEWWTASKGGLDLEDANVLESVYKEALKIEDDYLKQVEAEGKAAQEALRAEKK